MKNLIILLTLFTLLFLTGCAPFMYDPPFKAKVIDMHSLEPIEGAVARAFWTTWLLGAGGEITSYYDVDEAVSDKNGNIYLRGKGPRIFSNLNPMQVTVFKAGYTTSGGTVESISQNLWNRKSQDDKLIIYLRRLITKEKRRRSSGGIPFDAPAHKLRNYIIELAKDDMAKGRQPIRKYDGEIFLDNETIEKIRLEISEDKNLYGSPPEYKGPCRLPYRVYQENGAWKKEYFPNLPYWGLFPDTRPKCVEQFAEMRRLAAEHWKISGPCRLPYRVYQENGAWKKENFPNGPADEIGGDPRPECVEIQEEMRKLYIEHLWNP